MAKKRSRRTKRPSFSDWVRRLFRQPPRNFYGRASIYLCGNTLEIAQFRRIRFYGDDKLCLDIEHGMLTVYGDRLCILMLSAHRLILRGEILRTEFSHL